MTALAPSSAVSPNAWPALSARRLAWRTASSPLNFSSIQALTASVSRVYIQARIPRAKKFFDRPAWRPETPVPFTASLVRLVIGTSMTS